jgi:hypothetical protein
MRQIARTINAQNAACGARRSDVTGVPVGRDTIRGRTPEDVQGSLVPASVGRFLDEHTQIPDHPGASLFDIANVPIQLGRVTARASDRVAKSSLRTAVESVAGIPQGVKGIVTRSRRTGSRRGSRSRSTRSRRTTSAATGRSSTTPPGSVNRSARTTGSRRSCSTPRRLGVPAGRAATLLARSGPAGRAAAALSRVADHHGAVKPLAELADTAHRAARAPRDATRLAGLKARYDLAQLEGDTREASRLQARDPDAEANVQATGRPGLRFSGGEGGVKAQESSRNLFVGLGQRALDRSSGRV